MDNQATTHHLAPMVKSTWITYVLIALMGEKIIQHIVVTLAFYFDWKNIGSTVAVDPGILILLGAMVALLFMLALWGMIRRQQWATDLLIGLALFDIVGEFAAQGRIAIVITVSFVVAIVLLILSLCYRWQESPGAS